MVKVGTVVHELMHALGFLHEQNRSERDGYVYVNWQNIKAGTENNFEKASSQTTDAFGVGYDYGSVMHYSANAFSKNGQSTLVAKNGGSASLMGQREGLSDKDVQKLNAMYKCKTTSTATTSRPIRPNGASANTPNRPVLNFFGNLVSGFFQEENENNGTVSNTTEIITNSIDE